MAKLPARLFTFDKYLILFSILTILAIPRETQHNLHVYFGLLKIIEFYFVAKYFYHRFSKYQEIIIVSILVAGVIQAIAGLWQFFLQHSIGLHFFGEQFINPYLNGVAKIDTIQGKIIRAYGFFSHPNQLGAFLIVTCATIMFLYLAKSDTKIKYLMSILLIIAVSGTVATFSRSAILALLLNIAIVVIFVRKNKKIEPRTKKGLYLTVMTALILSFLLFGKFLGQRFIIPSGEPLDYRLKINSIALRYIKEHPLLGSGIGGMVPDLAEKIKPGQETWKIQPPHNYFVVVAYETGVVTATVLLISFLYLIARIYKSIKIGDRNETSLKITLFATIISVIFLMQTDHYFYTQQQTALLLWVLIGIIGSVIKIRHTKFSEIRAYS